MRSDESIALSLILPLIQRLRKAVLRSGSPVVTPFDSSLVRATAISRSGASHGMRLALDSLPGLGDQVPMDEVPHIRIIGLKRELD